jgi:predicted DsbA family dithiol-disulfide isomerase
VGRASARKNRKEKIMDKDSSPISIDYYTDVLCVWAWIAQPRLEEIRLQWGDRVKIHHRYIDIFGDARSKIPTQWGESDGYEKFHAHVAQSAKPYKHTNIHPDIWTTVRPNSSVTPHLILKAIEIVADGKYVDLMSTQLRQQFFTRAVDIGNLEVLLNMSSQIGVERSRILPALRDGRAMAALSSDIRLAKDSGIKGSPSWVLNNGRQVLYGNVGYRILSANIEELLNNPVDEASWC